MYPGRGVVCQRTLNCRAEEGSDRSVKGGEESEGAVNDSDEYYDLFLFFSYWFFSSLFLTLGACMLPFFPFILFGLVVFK